MCCRLMPAPAMHACLPRGHARCVQVYNGPPASTPPGPGARAVTAMAAAAAEREVSSTLVDRVWASALPTLVPNILLHVPGHAPAAPGGDLPGHHLLPPLAQDWQPWHATGAALLLPCFMPLPGVSRCMKAALHAVGARPAQAAAAAHPASAGDPGGCRCGAGPVFCPPASAQSEGQACLTSLVSVTMQKIAVCCRTSCVTELAGRS